jgi:hypothetical protein
MPSKVTVGKSLVRVARVFSVCLLALVGGWVAVAMYRGGRLAADLIATASDGDAAGVQGLLARGADVNAKDDHGRTALMEASWNGQLAVVQTLLAKGADVSAKDGWGETALMKASWNGQPEVVQALLAKGADVHAQDNSGQTALSMAYNDDVRKWLRDPARTSVSPGAK